MKTHQANRDETRVPQEAVRDAEVTRNAEPPRQEEQPPRERKPQDDLILHDDDEAELDLPR